MFVENILEALKSHVHNERNISFEFPEGIIEFFTDPKNLSPKNWIGIFEIEFKEEFRDKGLFKSLMNEITINHPSIEEVWIIEVCHTFSVILQTSKFNERYFTNKGCGEFYWIKTGAGSGRNRYDHERSERIAQELAPAKQMLVSRDREGFNEIKKSPEISKHL